MNPCTCTVQLPPENRTTSQDVWISGITESWMKWQNYQHAWQEIGKWEICLVKVFNYRDPFLCSATFQKHGNFRLSQCLSCREQRLHQSWIIITQKWMKHTPVHGSTLKDFPLGLFPAALLKCLPMMMSLKLISRWEFHTVEEPNTCMTSSACKSNVQNLWFNNYA